MEKILLSAFGCLQDRNLAPFSSSSFSAAIVLVFGFLVCADSTPPVFPKRSAIGTTTSFGDCVVDADCVGATVDGITWFTASDEQ